MSLVGSTYIQASSSDPGAVGFGYSWAQSDTGNIYYRNTANSAWVLAGNENQTYLGQLSRGGGTMTGAILGASGLMPTSGGDFSTAPTILGSAIATVPFVNTQIQNLQSQISTMIAQAIASTPGLSVSSKFAISAGFSGALDNNGTFTLPLPTYGDGTTAAAADVAGRYSAWPAVFAGADGVVTLATTSVAVTETGAGTRVFTIISINSQSAVPTSGYTIGYVIMAIRA